MLRRPLSADRAVGIPLSTAPSLSLVRCLSRNDWVISNIVSTLYLSLPPPCPPSQPAGIFFRFVYLGRFTFQPRFSHPLIQPINDLFCHFSLFYVAVSAAPTLLSCHQPPPIGDHHYLRALTINLTLSCLLSHILGSFSLKIVGGGYHTPRISPLVLRHAIYVRVGCVMKGTWQRYFKKR